MMKLGSLLSCVHVACVRAHATSKKSTSNGGAGALGMGNVLRHCRQLPVLLWHAGWLLRSCIVYFFAHWIASS